MTTETRTLALTLIVALVGWAAILGGTAVLGADRAAMVIAPPPGLIDRLPQARIEAAGPRSLTLGGVTAAQVWDAGGRAMLPVRRGGCLSLQRSVTRAVAD